MNNITETNTHAVTLAERITPARRRRLKGLPEHEIEHRPARKTEIIHEEERSGVYLTAYAFAVFGSVFVFIWFYDTIRPLLCGLLK